MFYKLDITICTTQLPQLDKLDAPIHAIFTHLLQRPTNAPPDWFSRATLQECRHDENPVAPCTLLWQVEANDNPK